MRYRHVKLQWSALIVALLIVCGSTFIIHAMTAPPLSAAPPPVRLGEFETDSPEGWAGSNTISYLDTVASTSALSSAYDGRYLLDAACSTVPANTVKYLHNSFTTPQDWSSNPVLALAVSTSGGAPLATAYHVQVTVTSITSSIQQVFSISPETWNRVSLDLSTFSGITSVTELRVAYYADTLSSDPWPCHVQLDHVTLEPRAVAQQRVAGFEDDTLDGWRGGDHVSTVARMHNLPNAPGGPYWGWSALDAASIDNAPADQPRTVLTTFVASDWSATPIVRAAVNVAAGPIDATAYHCIIILTSGAQVISITQKISPQSWNLVTIDLSSWSGITHVTGMAISVYADSGAAWNSHFDVDEVQRSPNNFPIFASADAYQAAQANTMLGLHWHALPGPNPATGNGQTEWREWDSLATAWIDTAHNLVAGVDYNAYLRSYLLNVEQSDDGFVYTYGQYDQNVDNTFACCVGDEPDWTFDGSTQGWSTYNTGQAAFIGTKWYLSTPASDPQIVSPAGASVSAASCPYIAVRMENENNATTAQLSFTTLSSPQYNAGSTVTFTVSNAGNWKTYYLPMYSNAQWTGTVTQLRLEPIGANGSAGQRIGLEDIRCAYDVRHATTNPSFILGSVRYFYWHPSDVDFLRANIARMRLAMHFMQASLGLDAYNYLVVPWEGHNGTMGSGGGLASNYWDLLPIGYKDLQDTTYAYAAEQAMSAIEGTIESHPEWSIPANQYGDTAASYMQKAHNVYQTIVTNGAFWDATTGRNGPSIDVTGVLHDYGFTFTNLEALYYGLGNVTTSRSIYDWLDGRRVVGGDTSTSADIYCYTFAPRTSTLNNTDWYPPAEPSFNLGVQNGGAILYTAYYDVMDRLRYLGADDAYLRMSTILNWFGQTQDVGGYRRYYALQGVQLQGHGQGGVVGVDAEFVESTLVPLTYLYGFLGIDAGPQGLEIAPHLPSSLPWMSVNNVAYDGTLSAITVTATSISIAPHIISGVLPLQFGSLQAGQSYVVTRDDVPFQTATADNKGHVSITITGVGIHTYSVTFPATAMNVPTAVSTPAVQCNPTVTPSPTTASSVTASPTLTVQPPNSSAPTTTPLSVAPTPPSPLLGSLSTLVPTVTPTPTSASTVSTTATPIRADTTVSATLSSMPPALHPTREPFTSAYVTPRPTVAVHPPSPLKPLSLRLRITPEEGVAGQWLYFQVNATPYSRIDLRLQVTGIRLVTKEHGTHWSRPRLVVLYQMKAGGIADRRGIFQMRWRLLYYPSRPVIAIVQARASSRHDIAMTSMTTTIEPFALVMRIIPNPIHNTSPFALQITTVPNGMVVYDIVIDGRSKMGMPLRSPIYHRQMRGHSDRYGRSILRLSLGKRASSAQLTVTVYAYQRTAIVTRRIAVIRG